MTGVVVFRPEGQGFNSGLCQCHLRGDTIEGGRGFCPVLIFVIDSNFHFRKLSKICYLVGGVTVPDDQFPILRGANQESGKNIIISSSSSTAVVELRVVLLLLFIIILLRRVDNTHLYYGLALYVFTYTCPLTLS